MTNTSNEYISITDRLKSSKAMQSLAMEGGIGSQLRALNWDVLHSCYYTDVKEGKLREVDVVGKQLWERKTKEGRQILILHLVIECKSAKEYHLLFAPNSNLVGQPQTTMISSHI
jgi:hypothetical protein